MNITEGEFKQIVQEEIERAIDEGWLDTARAAGSGAWAGTKAGLGRVGGAAKGALKSVATGEEVTIPASEKGAYKRNAAAKLLQLHRAKLSKNLENAMTQHNALVTDLNKDLKGKLRAWNLDQLPDVQTANQGLANFQKAIQAAQTSALGGLGNAAKYLIDPDSRPAPEAAAPAEEPAAAVDSEASDSAQATADAAVAKVKGQAPKPKPTSAPTKKKGKVAKKKGKAPAVPKVTAVNQNNLATRDADNYGADGKLSAKGMALAKAQIAFLKKTKKPIPPLLARAVSGQETARVGEGTNLSLRNMVREVIIKEKTIDR
jgi:hypothetical protein